MTMEQIHLWVRRTAIFTLIVSLISIIFSSLIQDIGSILMVAGMALITAINWVIIELDWAED